MNIGKLQQHWALLAAAVPALIAAVGVLFLIYRRSSRGQLATALKKQRNAEAALARAGKEVRRLGARLEKLRDRSASVKPRALQEAEDALSDARALHKILDDKHQVTTNQLRKVIFEEFPPARHEKLRARYLPKDVEDGRPFSF